MSKLEETDHVATEGASSKRNRIIFVGLALGVVLFLLALSCIQIVLPSQSTADQKKDYGYIYSGAKSESLDFVDAASAENTVLLFGSSELSTPSSVIPQVPAEVLGSTMKHSSFASRTSSIARSVRIVPFPSRAKLTWRSALPSKASIL